MALPCLAIMIDDRAANQAQQQREDHGFNTQHTWLRRNQLAIPQYNSQMTVDTLSTPPLGKAEPSTWKASCDLSTQLPKITAYIRSRLSRSPRLSCIADPGVPSIEKTHIIGHVSTSPHASSPGVASSRGASELSSSMRAVPSVHTTILSKRLNCNEEDSDYDDKEHRPVNKKRAKFESTPLQFACPFWKLDPNKHRSCSSATLSEIRYVKQHILRRHVQPIHCSTCWEIFEGKEDYTFHLRRMSCVRDDSSKLELEGIDPDLKDVLLSWRAKRGSSKEKQWFELWTILFPDLPYPSSPFMDEEVLTQSQPGYVSAQFNAPRINKRFKLSPNKRNVSRGLPKEEPKLPCPYYTRFPQRFCSSKWRSCSEPVWPTVDLLKEHIYRCHAAPLLTCPRCREPFDSIMDQVEHLKAEKICIIREESPEMEWLHKNQKQRLQQRSTETNEADKWREMYLILFPGAVEIPSPYHGESKNHGRWNDSAAEWKDPAVQRYSEYLDRELPRRIRRELDQRLDSGFGLLGDRITNQLVDIVREAQISLLQQYKPPVLFESNDEWNKTESARDTFVERCNSPNLTHNARTQPHTPQFHSTGAYEGLSSTNAPLTCQSHGHPFEDISSALASDFAGFNFDFLTDGEPEYLNLVSDAI